MYLIELDMGEMADDVSIRLQETLGHHQRPDQENFEVIEGEPPHRLQEVMHALAWSHASSKKDS